MKLVYLKHDDIDKKKWDAAISNAVNRMPYAFSFYLDITAPGWNALIAEDYKYLLPLTVNTKFLIPRLLQPSLSQQLGIFSNEEAGPDIIFEFLNFLQKKYPSIIINLNYRNTEAALKTDLKFIKKTTHHLHLYGNYEHIFKNYSTRRTRDLKKATKNKIEILVNDDIETYMQVFKQTTIKIIPEKDKLVSRLLYQLLQKGMLRIYTAYNKFNTAISSLVFIMDAKMIINILVSNTEEGKKSGANTLIIDRLIRDHSASELILDFEGSEISSIAEFFKSFGAKEIIYLQYKQNRFPFNLLYKKIS